MTDPILYLVGRYPCLSETFIAREVDELRRRGRNITVVGLDEIRWRPAVMAAARIPRVALSLYAALRSDAGPRFGRCAAAVLRAAEIAARPLTFRHIHAHFFGAPASAAYCLSRMTGVPYSLSTHARDLYVVQTPDIVLAEARFRAVCTRTNAAFLEGKYPRLSFDLVRHGIDVSPQAHHRIHRSEGPFELLAVGRLVEKKGFVYLVRACAALKNAGVAFACTIIGEGPERSRLAALISELGLEREVHLADALPHATVMSRYADADLLVAPSIEAADGDRDGIPNVVLEAMASGLPVLATGAGSLPEIVRNGGTGIVVPPKNEAELARGIQTLFADAALRAQLAQNAASALAEEFSCRHWLDELERLLDA